MAAILRHLRHVGVSGGAELCQVAGISRSTLSRLLRSHQQQSGERLLVIGRARATRYALRRPVRGVEVPVPVYRIGRSPQLLCWLHPIAPAGFFLQSDVMGDAITPGLPWWLQTMRPRGFLGRWVPHQHPELALPDDIRLWSDDDVLRYLTRHGWAMVGGCIIGRPAFVLFGTSQSPSHPWSAPLCGRRSRTVRFSVPP